jgi:murein lipoprotein
MPRLPHRSTSVILAIALIAGGASLSGCATKKYVREQIEVVNTRVSAVDARVTDAISRADAANAAAQSAASSAQSANSAAQSAAADARNANQRLDQLTPRVDALEQNGRGRRARH